MSVHLSEEEQIENLKRWWQENGRSTIIGVVLAVVAYFGWQGWQNHQQQQRDEASALYEDLLNTAVAEPGQTLTEEKIATAMNIADELKDKYGSGLYAVYGALFAAKLSVDQNDLDRAETELQWVINNHKDNEYALVARERLAQVYYAKTLYDDALSALNAVEPQNFAASYEELKGDIYIAKNMLPEAKLAYEAALNSLLTSQGDRRGIVQMKLNDIRLPTDGENSSEPSAEGASS